MNDEISLLVEVLSNFEGVSVLNSDDTWVTFRCVVESTLASITSQVVELQDSTTCKFMIYPHPDDPEQVIYQLIFEGEGEEKRRSISVVTKVLKNILESGSVQRAKHKELGIPDLSLVTLRQMAVELKQRENLCFALVWMEQSERDNIAIEGSGNPTQLVGLLARGLNMAIDWADKNIKFRRPKDEE